MVELAVGFIPASPGQGYIEPVVIRHAVIVPAAEDGTVWGVAADYSIWKYNGGANWQRIPGPAAKYVSVGSSGNAWALMPAGNAYQYVDGHWYSRPGVLSQISVGAK